MMLFLCVAKTIASTGFCPYVCERTQSHAAACGVEFIRVTYYFKEVISYV